MRSKTNHRKNFEGLFLRVSEAFIYNNHVQLWIPRRDMNKSIAPGGLDFSASGHVAAGESYLQGLKREAKEELDLDIDLKLLKLVYKFPPTGVETMFFRSIYLYYYNEAPQYNADDFSGYEWLTPEELLKKPRSGEPAKRSLQETVEYLIAHKSEIF